MPSDSEDVIVLDVKCPFQDCNNSKKITVPAYIFKNKAFGTLKIQIHKGKVCPDHQFMVFVDKKGKIRGYEKIDLQFTVAKKAPSPEKLEVKGTLVDVINELNEFATVNLIHAFLVEVPVVIFTKKNPDSENLVMIKDIFKGLFPEVFEHNPNVIEIRNRTDFKNFKFDDKLGLDEEGYIISSKWDINVFELENNMLRTALETNDLPAQRIIFKQNKDSLLKKVERVAELLDERETLYEEDIKDIISKEFMQKKLTDYDVDLFKEILKFKFKKDISKIKIRSFDKLKESLW